MKDKKPLDWIPIYIDKHLFGSTRLELEPDERGVWMDLLILSGKDSVHVRANEGMPYSIKQLAGMLVIPEELLERTIKKCIEHTKIEIREDGTIYILKWEQYRLSLRHKRRFEETNEIIWDKSIKPTYKINDEIRSSMYYAIKKKHDGGLWEKLLGYTRGDLIAHLGKNFSEGMTWENYGKWHIDHIRPLSESKYSSFTQINEIREFWKLENLQPLWEKDNLRKANKSPEEDTVSPKEDTIGESEDTIERVIEIDKEIEKEKKKKKPKKPPPPKRHYAEFVTLTEDEYLKLIKKYGEDRTLLMIEELNNFIGSTGHPYKSHYFTILRWVAREILKKHPLVEERESKTPKPPEITYEDQIDKKKQKSLGKLVDKYKGDMRKKHI